MELPALPTENDISLLESCPSWSEKTMFSVRALNEVWRRRMEHLRWGGPSMICFGGMLLY